MARLHKLYIKGVRSYGPFDDDEQCVVFMSPITLIMGQNGSGKTTVIEALKYATTGDAPPGSQRGQYFIHDPKLSSVSEVYAMIKLVFKDVEDQEWSVTRRMKLNEKLKTLELMISRVDKEGVNRDFRGRCGNENVLSVALGVSKPILNHVIFCHQEESCWPLDEAKTLKEKFDAIFNITKYNKCIEIVRKLCKKIEDELKVLNNQLANDQIHKKQAEDKRRSFRETEERCADSSKKIENFENDLEEVRKALEKVYETERNINKLQCEHDSKKRQLEVVKNHQIELRQTIKEEFAGSTQELYNAIEMFNEKLSVKENELTELEASMQVVKAEEREVVSEVSQLQLQVARMEEEQRQQQSRERSRNSTLAQLARQLGLQELDPAEVAHVAEVMSEVRRKVALLKEQLDAVRVQLEAEEQHSQSKIDNCREEVTSLNQEIRMKKEQLNQKKSDERKAARQIAGVKISDADVEKVDAELDRVTMDLKVAQSMHEAENWKEKLGELRGQRTEFEKNLRAVDERVIELQSQSNLLAEIKILEQTKAEKEEKILSLEKDLQKPMMMLFKKFPSTNIKQCMDDVLSKCENAIREKNKLVNAKQNELSMLEYKRKEQDAKLSSMEEEVQRNKDSIFDMCGSDDLETTLKSLQKEIQDLQDEKGVLSSSEAMYRHYIDKMQQNKPCCPLCHRGFQEQASVEELIGELTGKMSAVPALLRAKEGRLEALQKKYDNLLQLQPAHKHCRQLKTVDIPAARSALEETGRRAEQALAAGEELRRALSELQTREKVAKGALGDVLQLSQLRAEVTQLEQRRAGMVANMIDDPAQSLQATLDKQSRLRKDLDATSKELDNLRTRFDSSQTELNNLQDRRNQLFAKHLKIQGDLQMRRQLEEKREECEKDIAVLSISIDDLSERLEPANIQLQTAIEDKVKLQTENRRKLDTKRSEVGGAQKQLDEAEKLQRDIEAYEQRGVPGKLRHSREEVQRLEASRAALETRRQGVADRIDHVRLYLASQKDQERELQDNLKLRDKLEEERELAGETKELRRQVAAVSGKAVLLKRRQLETEHTALLTEKAQCTGQLKELKEIMGSLQKELNTPIFKNADDKFNETSFTIKVKHLAKEDLQSYSQAMEWAVTHFHSERMKIINTIIRNLWRQIYCGSDIDYIEIKTGSDAKSTMKRRSYTYKVVQVKSGVEMNMRGRCSGGQKVLASLIIRIALAETFSTKCAFLALDEPTANLDRENINNFVHALADIVKTRGVRRKFQLIIITHDQQFLEMLNDQHLATEYFRVDRNARARSVIEKHRVVL
ncbi:DNA repair protein RAD50-like [Bacillus rossius redtenbacheri]|uniref:DNA repair protein RAD50-like n=1 Tax=Bacillus rossius redtenbacheri TaxID=93214 RepID=UPI002FDE8FAC